MRPSLRQSRGRQPGATRSPSNFPRLQSARSEHQRLLAAHPAVRHPVFHAGATPCETPGPTSHSSCGETPRREKTNPEHGRSAAGPRTTRWARAERSTRSCLLDPAFHNLLFEPENDKSPWRSLRSSTRRRQEPPSRQTPVRRLSLTAFSSQHAQCVACGTPASVAHPGLASVRPISTTAQRTCGRTSPPGPSRLHCACNHAAHRAHRSHHRICRILWCS